MTKDFKVIITENNEVVMQEKANGVFMLAISKNGIEITGSGFIKGKMNEEIMITSIVEMCVSMRNGLPILADKVAQEIDKANRNDEEEEFEGLVYDFMKKK